MCSRRISFRAVIFEPTAFVFRDVLTAPRSGRDDNINTVFKSLDSRFRGNDKLVNLRNLILVFGLVVMLLVQTGCVERKLTINTEPAGALVWLNDEEIGLSPVAVEFNWYGDYKVRISKEGYETLDTHRELKAPLHDGFPIDFFAEILWPGRIVDEYEWSFRLAEYQPPERAELIEAAQQMKQMAAAEFEEGMRQQAEEQKATDRGEL